MSPNNHSRVRYTNHNLLFSISNNVASPRSFILTHIVNLIPKVHRVQVSLSDKVNPDTSIVVTSQILLWNEHMMTNNHDGYKVVLSTPSAVSILFVFVSVSVSIFVCLNLSLCPCQDSRPPCPGGLSWLWCLLTQGKAKVSVTASIGKAFLFNDGKYQLFVMSG